MCAHLNFTAKERSSSGQTAIFGINSNLDTEGIIDNLVLLQRQPIDIVEEAKRALEEAKLLTFQDLRSRLQTFKGIVNTLNTEARFLATQGAFNNNGTDTNSVVSLSTTSSATSGTFSLVVNNLAQETKLVSDGFASTSGAVTQGTIDITVGGTTTTITIDDTNDTADGLRLAINNSGLNVNATFLNDSSDDNPLRIVLSATQTGTDNSISIGSGSTVTFTETQAAQDASFVLDGVAVTKSSNTVTDVISGTILTLESAGSRTVTLTSDTDAIKEKIQSYVDGYNEIQLYLSSQLAIESETGETGVLFANFTIQNLQDTLRNTATSRVVGVDGDFEFLSQIGIRTLSDGTLSIDDGDLTDALAADGTDSEGLNFRISSLTDGSYGFITLSIGVAQITNRILENLTDASLGRPSGSRNRYRNSKH